MCVDYVMVWWTIADITLSWCHTWKKILQRNFRPWDLIIYSSTYLGQKTWGNNTLTKLVPSSMTVMHFHYALVAHAIWIMMTSACLIACVVTWLQLDSHRIYASNCLQKRFITAKPEKNQRTKSWRCLQFGDTLQVRMRGWGFTGDFDLERILYST